MIDAILDKKFTDAESQLNDILNDKAKSAVEQATADIVSKSFNEATKKTDLYKNKNWTKRNYDYKNVVFQKVPVGQTPLTYSGEIDKDNWVKHPGPIPKDMKKLGGVINKNGDADFWGYP